MAMNKWQKRMDDAFKKFEDIRKKAEAEGRALTAEELEQRTALRAEIDQANKEWDDFKAEEELRGKLYGEGGGALTIEGPGNIEVPDAPIYRGSNATALGQQLLDIRTLSDPSKHGNTEVQGAKSRLERSQKRYEARMVALAEKESKEGKESRAAATGGFTVGVPSDGGFFLQGETVVDLMTNGFNNSEILPRTAKRTLTATQFIEIFGIDETSRKTGSRGGGIRVFTNKELGEYEGSKTQFKMVRVEPKKLTGLFNASDEWMKNVTFLGQEVRALFGDEFAFKCQDLSFRGSGAGEALGFLNSGCLVTVPKKTGQKAGTILSGNLSDMWMRFNGKKQNALWMINRDCGAQLDELSIVAGTGALEPRFVNYGPDGILRIKGVPVVEIEQCETVGTVGDIVLADWSQYVTADQGDINEAMSIHVNFVYGQQTFRFTYYFDGQFRQVMPLTPFKGSNTVSPAVALAARA
jgi:HK97 family phage major capsid protein